MHMEKADPPLAFAVVADGVYRSNAPAAHNLAFLARLQLKTIIYLSPDVLLRPVATFVTENNIQMHNLGSKSWRPEASWTPVTDQLIKNALELLLDSSNHPVLVCCTSGIHQTGVLIGCLRRLSGWSITSIVEEYHSFVGTKARVAHEQFIELFDPDIITVPKACPEWFTTYRTMAAEEVAMQQRLATEAPAPAPASEDAQLNDYVERFVLNQSGRLVSPGTTFTSKSLVDDEEDD